VRMETTQNGGRPRSFGDFAGKLGPEAVPGPVGHQLNDRSPAVDKAAVKQDCR